MTKLLRDVQALTDAVEHWERIRDGVPGERPYSMQCACCKLYLHLQCDGCPVAEYAGDVLCEETPYGRFMDLFYAEADREVILDHDEDGDIIVTPELRSAAQSMIDFLMVIRRVKEQDRVQAPDVA